MMQFYGNSETVIIFLDYVRASQLVKNRTFLMRHPCTAIHKCFHFCPFSKGVYNFFFFLNVLGGIAYTIQIYFGLLRGREH